MELDKSVETWVETKNSWEELFGLSDISVPKSRGTCLVWRNYLTNSEKSAKFETNEPWIKLGILPKSRHAINYLKLHKLTHNPYVKGV